MEFLTGFAGSLISFLVILTVWFLFMNLDITGRPGRLACGLGVFGRLRAGGDRLERQA